MTRRQRLERKLEKRQEWAEKAKNRSAAAFNRARGILEPIPFGQPVLVGHHSEKRHRRALDRADSAIRRAGEEHKLAEHHESRAAGLERQLDRSIYSDDPDAVEQLEAKAAELELQREEMKRRNTLYRRGGWRAVFPDATPERIAELDAQTAALPSFNRAPHPAYQLQNLGAEIRRARARIEDIKRRQARAARAEAAGGTVVEFSADRLSCQVTFAECPPRATREELKAAGFHFSGGSWFGPTAGLPAALVNV